MWQTVGASLCLLLLGLSQPIRGFPTIESGTFQRKTHECDITLYKKGVCTYARGHLVLVLDTEHFAWHLVPGTSCVHSVVGRKRVLSQDLAAASNSKNAFLSFA